MFRSQLCSTTEAAAALGVCEKTVRRAIKDGKLPAVRIGVRVLVNRSEIVGFAGGRKK